MPLFYLGYKQVYYRPALKHYFSQTQENKNEKLFKNLNFVFSCCLVDGGLNVTYLNPKPLA